MVFGRFFWGFWRYLEIVVKLGELENSVLGYGFFRVGWV